MDNNTKMRQFRRSFNRLSDNAKSVIVFTSAVAVFSAMGLHTGFSWLGMLVGIALAFVCSMIFVPVSEPEQSDTQHDRQSDSPS